MRSPSATGPTPRILIVGDDVSVSDSFSRMLRLRGYEVWAALSGGEGIGLAHRHTPDAVIVDLRMPAQSSLRILTAMRAIPALTDTPLALVTGDYHLSEDDHREVVRLGASVRYKPLWLGELVMLAQELLSVSVGD